MEGRLRPSRAGNRPTTVGAALRRGMNLRSTVQKMPPVRCTIARPTHAGTRQPSESSESHRPSRATDGGATLVADVSPPSGMLLSNLPPGGPQVDAKSGPDTQARAIEILRTLADEFPQIPDYRYDLSKAYARIDPRDPRFSGNRSRIAEGRLREAIAILDRLLAEHPNVPDYTASYVQALYTLSEVLRRTDSSDDAEPLLRQAMDRQSSLVNQFPKVHPYKAWNAILKDALAKILAESGRTTKARSLLESATSSLDEILKNEPRARYVHPLLGRCYKNLAAVLSQAGEEQKAAEILRIGRQYRPD